jgi:hypothetical protein
VAVLEGGRVSSRVYSENIQGMNCCVFQICVKFGSVVAEIAIVHLFTACCALINCVRTMDAIWQRVSICPTRASYGAL